MENSWRLQQLVSCWFTRWSSLQPTNWSSIMPRSAVHDYRGKSLAASESQTTQGGVTPEQNLRQYDPCWLMDTACHGGLVNTSKGRFCRVVLSLMDRFDRPSRTVSVVSPLQRVAATTYPWLNFRSGAVSHHSVCTAQDDSVSSSRLQSSSQQ